MTTSRKTPMARSKMAAQSLCLLWAILVTLQTAHADDQTKTAKQVRRISALAADKTARPLVSDTIAQFLKVPRMDLVRERQAYNLSYGSLFLAHQLTAFGTTLEQISEKLHAGQTLWDIGKEQHADWQRIANDTKKLNDKVEAAFYDFFLNGLDPAHHRPDGYDAAKDVVAADQEGLTKEDLEAAQDTYARCFRRARGWADPKDLPNQNNRDMPRSDGDPR